MVIQKGFAFARCADGLMVVLEGVVSAEDVDAWAQARQNAQRKQCDPDSIFILPYDEAMRAYGDIIRNHFHLREIQLQRFEARRQRIDEQEDEA